MFVYNSFWVLSASNRARDYNWNLQKHVVTNGSRSRDSNQLFCSKGQMGFGGNWLTIISWISVKRKQSTTKLYHYLNLTMNIVTLVFIELIKMLKLCSIHPSMHLSFSAYPNSGRGGREALTFLSLSSFTASSGSFRWRGTAALLFVLKPNWNLINDIIQSLGTFQTSEWINRFSASISLLAFGLSLLLLLSSAGLSPIWACYCWRFSSCYR